jgi:hypothetical protein
MLIIEFKNKQCAQLWLDSDRKFRNKEWPSASSSLEIIMVPLLYKPPKSKLNILKFVTNHFFLLQEKNENFKIISFLCSKIILGTDDIILRTARDITLTPKNQVQGETY